jgi:uncharacterized protein YjbI with pentapeptide repeats
MKEDFLKLYREGERNFPGVDLSGMYFDEDLSGINLEGANLRKTRLCEAKLANANLKNADLRGVEIRAELFGHNIDFSGGNFEGTEMYEGIIQKANFSRANFRNSSFAQFLMTECNCAEADFTNTWSSETDFSGGNFNGAIFCKTLIDVNFWDADISGADAEETLRQAAQRVDQISDPQTQANLMAASGILAGLKLEDEIIYRVLRRDIMQESTVYRSIQRETQIEEKRAIALNFLREGLSVDLIARGTGLSIEEVQQLQKQIDNPSQN